MDFADPVGALRARLDANPAAKRSHHAEAPCTALMALNAHSCKRLPCRSASAAQTCQAQSAPPQTATAQSDAASSLPRNDPGTPEERMVTAVPFSLCVPECDRSFAPGRVQFPTRKNHRLICCCDESRRGERVEQTGKRVREPLELVRPSSEHRDPAVLPAGRLRVEAVSLRTGIGAEKHEPRHGAGDFLRLAF